jgi:hypothetical protein
VYPGMKRGPQTALVRADDGIDPRPLAKVTGPLLPTCGDILIWLARWAFFDRVQRDRFPLVRGRSQDPDGTPHEPVLPVDLRAQR